MMPKKIALAIDIGGTKTAFGFVTEDGKIPYKTIIDTGVSSDPNELIGRIKKAVDVEYGRIKTGNVFSGIGIGAPNANYFKGTVEYAANLKWKGIIPLGKLFSSEFNLPVSVTNDANAAAVGEMYFGGAKGMKDFIFITLGTGLGSGIIANGDLIYGHQGFAGELGHTIIIQHGRSCGCGRKGCLEQYCSATGIVKTYLEILKNDGRPMPDETSVIDSKYIFEKAMGGDEAAFYAFNYTGELLGFALANSVAYTDPEAIFLFGGLAQAGEMLFNPVVISFEKNLLNIYKNKVKILSSGLPENDAALLGAASVLWNDLNKQNKS
jgi:glucokinase